MNKNILVYINNLILWILAIGYFFIISSFSTTPAVESRAESKAVVVVVEKIVNAVMHKTEDNSDSWVMEKTLHTIVRKTAHVVNFFILAFLHGMLFFVYSGKISNVVILTLLMGCCGAVTDEITQLFVEGRSAQLSDVFVDFSGTILACALFVFLCHRYILKLKRG